jgi:hypothetical protein
MSYTTLRVTELGVVLYEAHRARLGPAAERAFDAFAASAAPGVYSLSFTDQQLTVIPRAGSRSSDGQPTRRMVSPFVGQHGAFAKRGSPTPYDGVRVAAVTTLLTDASLTEVYESCVASVVAWNGSSVVVVPDDRPRVDSLADRFVREHVSHAVEPIRADHAALLVINAVTATIPAGSAFPLDQRLALTQALAATARRPH